MKLKLQEAVEVKEAEEIVQQELPHEEVAAENNKPKEDAELLILSMKIASLNLKVLHRNLEGGNWFVIHPLLGDYYDKIDEYEDDLIECLVPLGVSDVAVRVDEKAPILSVKPYAEIEAMQITKTMFDNILQMLQNVREELHIPTSITSVFDEIENYLYIESNFKIAKYLVDKNN